MIFQVVRYFDLRNEREMVLYIERQEFTRRERETREDQRYFVTVVNQPFDSRTCSTRPLPRNDIDVLLFTIYLRVDSINGRYSVSLD